METTVIERAAFVAEYQAKAALRCGRAGDDAGFARHLDKMNAMIAGSKYPASVAKGLVQLVGRGKAMVLGVPRRIINQALAENAPVLACHYLAVGGPVISLQQFTLSHVERVGDAVGLYADGELAASVTTDDAAELAESLEVLVGCEVEVESHDGQVVAVREV